MRHSPKSWHFIVHGHNAYVNNLYYVLYSQLPLIDRFNQIFENQRDKTRAEICDGLIVQAAWWFAAVTFVVSACNVCVCLCVSVSGCV